MLPAKCSYCWRSGKLKGMIDHVTGHLASRPGADAADRALLLEISPQVVQFDHWMLAWVSRAAALGDLAGFLERTWIVPWRQDDGKEISLSATTVDGDPLGHNMAVHEAFAKSLEMAFVSDEESGLRARCIGEVARYDANRVAGIAAMTALPPSTWLGVPDVARLGDANLGPL